MAGPDEPTTQTDSEAPVIPWAEIHRFFAQRHWLVCLLIVLLGLALRVGGLTGYWINPDEGIYYGALTATFEDFWSVLTDNAHPPLYYLLLRGMGILSVDFVWFRTLSLVSGCLVIWGVYLLGKETGGLLTGILAAFLIAIAPSAIELSQIIRPYMFQVSALTFALYFLVRYFRTARIRDLVLYTVTMVVALLTHYSSFLVMGGVGLVLLTMLLARKLTGKELLRLSIAHLPIAVAMLAMLGHLGVLLDSDLQKQAQTGWLEPHMIHTLSMVWLNLIGVMRYLFGTGYSGPAILLLFAGVFMAATQRRYLVVGIPLSVIAMAIVAAAIQQYPFGSTRHNIYLLPILAVPMVLPIATGLQRGRRAAILTALAAFALVVPNQMISNLLGAGSYEHQALKEQVLPRADVGRARQMLEDARSGRGPILMQSQSFNTLIPLFGRAPLEKDWMLGDFFQMPWGENKILVNLAWTMTTDEDPADPNESFYGFLTRVQTAMPELNILEQTDATLASAGWLLRLEQDLLEIDVDNRDNPILDPRSAYQKDNVSVFTIDLKRAAELLRR